MRKIIEYKKNRTLLNAMELIRHSECAIEPELKKIKIGIIRNYTIEPLLPIIKANFIVQGFLPEINITGVGTYAAEVMLDSDSDWRKEKYDAIIIMFWPEVLSDIFRFDMGNKSIAEIKESLNNVQKQLDLIIKACALLTNGPVMIANRFAVGERIFGRNYEIKNLELDFFNWYNNYVINKVKDNNKCHLIDFEAVSINAGLNTVFNRQGFIEKLYPFTNLGMRLVSNLIANEIVVLLKGSKKCIVVDCDNTLWGGVVGEVGASGVALQAKTGESPFIYLQNTLKHLKNLGFLLATCSKNNCEDVMEVFNTRSDMVLKSEDFVTHRINWNRKDENIKSIANEIGIGLDSLIFIDDSDFECMNVSECIPEVYTYQFNENNFEKLQELRNGSIFSKVLLADEDLKKTELYKAKSAIETGLNGDGDNDFIYQMGIEVEIFEIDQNTLTRAAQLTQKTNQFNFTTRRYSEVNIQEFIESQNYDVFGVRCLDKFVDHGIISLVIINKNNGFNEIDTFLMSCRVLSRGVDKAIISWLMQKYTALKAEYVRTAKNKMLIDSYITYGFREIHNQDDTIVYEWDEGVSDIDSDKVLLKCPDWIALKGKI